ncbi:alkaline phosphatase PafA [Flavobacterium sp.]|uniref:alkaline phosphatase PafA n=1 Tax=Flavobacterium sp. TaxID=239 RepID=UPI0038FC1B9C
MRKYFFLIFIIFIANIQAQQRPKLVVGIVVDQMKMEYLYRFSDDFSPNGFKRLMNNGYTFNNMHFNYMPTYTAPGHASIYTGATPSTHGIIANDWFNRSLGKDMYCTDDVDVKTLGDGSLKEGLMSPKNLLSTTITDELRMATNFKGKVIGISLKDRGAILPAGHFANWAFWYSNTGAFISSSFYGVALPDWVTEFNNEKKYMNYINKGWDLLKPLATYNESLIDDNPYESKIDKTKGPVFPYDLAKLYASKGAETLRVTPYGNDYLADFAIKAIQNENLGKDDITDFITISFSSTDYIGHEFGPRSMEIQDTYLRLDETLAKFLNYLDTTVGKDNYLLFLTADHAGAENLNYLKDNKYNVKTIVIKEFVEGLKQFSLDTFGVNLVLDYSNFNLYFDRKVIKERNLDFDKIKIFFKDYIKLQDHVRRVYDEEEILTSSESDYYLSFIAKGYDPKQSGDLVVLDKLAYTSYKATGTTHGSPNSYDTHVPLLFYGWHIPKGESFAKKQITQIAPTLSQMLRITFPNGTESQVLEEVLGGK